MKKVERIVLRGNLLTVAKKVLNDNKDELKDKTVKVINKSVKLIDRKADKITKVVTKSNVKILLTIFVLFSINKSFSQQNTNIEAYTKKAIYGTNGRLTYISISETKPVNQNEVPAFINSMVLKNSANKVILKKEEQDEFGFTHTKYTITNNGIPLCDKVIIAHSKNGKLISLNGDLEITNVTTPKFGLTENVALTAALKKIGAKKYKWENKAEEAQMRLALKEPHFSYYPKGEKVIIEKDGDYLSASNLIFMPKLHYIVLMFLLTLIQVKFFKKTT